MHPDASPVAELVLVRLKGDAFLVQTPFLRSGVYESLHRVGLASLIRNWVHGLCLLRNVAQRFAS